MADLERWIGRTEDFVRRNLRSRAAREAQKRDARRTVEGLLRRLRRAGLLFLLLVLALIVWSQLVAPLGLLWVLALPAAAFAAFLSLFFPERSRRAAAPGIPAGGAEEMPLEALVSETEDWLVERCRHLPGRLLPYADAVCERLEELRPCLARLDPADPLTGEARRLIGRHLPNLVDSYLALPPSRRDPDGETSRRLAESLATLTAELDRLQTEASRERSLSFETHARFIETRYRGDGIE